VYLFQDGAWNPHSGITKTDRKLTEECCGHFSKIIPQGQIILSETNLGIAGNYRRADDLIFIENEAPHALFLEDDLVLSVNYLRIIDRLLKVAEASRSIGYVSAYGDLWASLQSQRRAPGLLRPMHENWGSALTRQSWLKQRKVRDQYWELVRNCDYSQRDHTLIRRYYRTLGYDMTISGQDGSRWIACSENDLARVTTTACHARYIGETGEHFDPGRKKRRPPEGGPQIALDRSRLAAYYAKTALALALWKPAKPRPAKPSVIIAQVEASGTTAEKVL